MPEKRKLSVFENMNRDIKKENKLYFDSRDLRSIFTGFHRAMIKNTEEILFQPSYSADQTTFMS
eukprot:snap_masked-scaffold_75-processed-gene-0.34-mRNA-1 protein AED:1.00 eAED:1.00 QI:0/0/0/0/1/1/2/0/63